MDLVASSGIKMLQANATMDFSDPKDIDFPISDFSFREPFGGSEFLF